MTQAKEKKPEVNYDVKPEGFIDIDANVLELARTISKEQSEKDLVAIKAKIEVLQEFQSKIFEDHKGKTIPSKTLRLKLQALIEVLKEFLAYRREVNKYVK